jgi:hypothetical protein
MDHNSNNIHDISTHSLTDKIRFENIYENYLECLATTREKKPECKDIIKTFHYLLEKQDVKTLPKPLPK